MPIQITRTESWVEEERFLLCQAQGAKQGLMPQKLLAPRWGMGRDFYLGFWVGEGEHVACAGRCLPTCLGLALRGCLQRGGGGHGEIGGRQVRVLRSCLLFLFEAGSSAGSRSWGLGSLRSSISLRQRLSWQTQGHMISQTLVCLQLQATWAFHNL